MKSIFGMDKKIKHSDEKSKSPFLEKVLLEKVSKDQSRTNLSIPN